ncbi:MAG: thiamine pyrophosphate-binding protein, partial [Gemmatimonadales bacterium]
MKTGADGVCSVLEGLGVRTVFGLPGTQNVSLFEGLRQSALRTVLTTDELAATFMAGGYFRASGRVAGVFAIPGPGLAYAVAGLAEARHDSAALLLITGVPASGPGRHFQLQRMDQAGMAAPVVKGCFRVDTSAQIEEIIGVAHGTALSGEPGPVVVEISDAALVARWDGTVAPASSRVLPAPSQADLDQVLDRFRRALRPLLLVGQGAAGAAEAAGLLAEHFGAPVLTTLSGRGIVADDHPLGLGRDLGFGVEEANQLIEEADLVLALGCKFSHNGTGGFRLRINPRQLVHVDASSEVLGANYPASAAIQADVPSFVSALLEAMAQQTPARDVKEWGKSLDRARQSVQERAGQPEPVTVGGNRTPPATFFEALRAATPRDAIFVTDSGRHQAMARRHFPVYCPRGFLAPSDFQSMGFGLPAAIG